MRCSRSRMIMVTTVMPNDDHNDRLVAGRPPTAKVLPPTQLSQQDHHIMT